MQNVLDSVISALLEDKNRKFIYVEIVIHPTYFIHLFFSLLLFSFMIFCPFLSGKLLSLVFNSCPLVELNSWNFQRHSSRDGGGSKAKL